MLGHTHLLFGAVTLAAAEVALRTTTGVSLVTTETADGALSAAPALCLAAALVGSLAPDLDAEDSTIQRELGGLGVLAHLGLNLLGVKHRGLLHSGLAMLLVTAAAVVIGRRVGFETVGLAFGLGYISHVALADALTISGVPLWWPGQTRFHLLPHPFRVRTGGPAEKLVALVMVGLLVWLLPQAVPPAWISLAQKWLS
jgi:membrane-bound metal-dependent hydrolase YbcI (DUF457 family)